MKTPYAILIGLALIAAALFFRLPAVAPAQAGLIGNGVGIACTATLSSCAVLHGDEITWVYNAAGPARTRTSNWR